MAKSKKGKAEEIEVLDLGFETPKPTSSKNKKTNQKRKKEKENIFTRLKDNWLDLTHKQRTIIIVIACSILLIVISTLLYIFLTKEVSPNKKKEVVVAKDNYRYEDGILYFVANNKDIGSYKCQNKDEKLCYVAYETTDDDFDEVLVLIPFKMT